MNRILRQLERRSAGMASNQTHSKKTINDYYAAFTAYEDVKLPQDKTEMTRGWSQRDSLSPKNDKIVNSEKKKVIFWLSVSPNPDNADPETHPLNINQYIPIPDRLAKDSNPSDLEQYQQHLIKAQETSELAEFSAAPDLNKTRGKDNSVQGSGCIQTYPPFSDNEDTLARSPKPAIRSYFHVTKPRSVTEGQIEMNEMSLVKDIPFTTAESGKLKFSKAKRRAMKIYDEEMSRSNTNKIKETNDHETEGESSDSSSKTEYDGSGCLSKELKKPSILRPRMRSERERRRSSVTFGDTPRYIPMGIGKRVNEIYNTPSRSVLVLCDGTSTKSLRTENCQYAEKGSPTSSSQVSSAGRTDSASRGFSRIAQSGSFTCLYNQQAWEPDDTYSHLTRTPDEKYGHLTKDNDATYRHWARTCDDTYSHLTRAPDDTCGQLPKDNDDTYSHLTKDNDGTYRHLIRTRDDTYSHLTRTRDATYSHLTRTRDDTYSHLTKAPDDAYSHLTRTPDDTCGRLPKDNDDTYSHLTRAPGDTYSHLTRGTAKTNGQSANHLNDEHETLVRSDNKNIGPRSHTKLQASIDDDDDGTHSNHTYESIDSNLLDNLIPEPQSRIAAYKLQNQFADVNLFYSNPYMGTGKTIGITNTPELDNQCEVMFGNDGDYEEISLNSHDSTAPALKIIIPETLSSELCAHVVKAVNPPLLKITTKPRISPITYIIIPTSLSRKQQAIVRGNTISRRNTSAEESMKPSMSELTIRSTTEKTQNESERQEIEPISQATELNFSTIKPSLNVVDGHRLESVSSYEELYSSASSYYIYPSVSIKRTQSPMSDNDGEMFVDALGASSKQTTNSSCFFTPPTSSRAANSFSSIANSDNGSVLKLTRQANGLKTDSKTIIKKLRKPPSSNTGESLKTPVTQAPSDQSSTAKKVGISRVWIKDTTHSSDIFCTPPSSNTGPLSSTTGLSWKSNMTSNDTGDVDQPRESMWMLLRNVMGSTNRTKNKSNTTVLTKKKATKKPIPTQSAADKAVVQQDTFIWGMPNPTPTTPQTKPKTEPKIQDKKPEKELQKNQTRK